MSAPLTSCYCCSCVDFVVENDGHHYCKGCGLRSIAHMNADELREALWEYVLEDLQMIDEFRADARFNLIQPKEHEAQAGEH